jgi:hypothetical protein
LDVSDKLVNFLVETVEVLSGTVLSFAFSLDHSCFRFQTFVESSSELSLSPFLLLLALEIILELYFL